MEVTGLRAAVPIQVRMARHPQLARVLGGRTLLELGGASLGFFGDLDRLWTSAQERYDLSAQDAVILLEKRHVTLTGNGTVRTTVHRVVWIGSARGIRGYADLRIPWNSAASTMTCI